MLYDQSQLARVYLHAWQASGSGFFRTITEEILDYVVREMVGPGGGFYSTQDTDSEGEEGKFYVWTVDEIREVLGDDAQADEFMIAYGVIRHGNFEGKNTLEFVGDMDQRPALAKARRQLFEAREQRVHPGRDEKVLSSWNGLMLAAFAEAARALDRDDYRRVAERNAIFFLRELLTEDGRLFHTWKTGRAKQNGFLEDYAYLVEGLLELYQTTFDPRWFVAAHELAETMIARFQAPEGGFFDTSDDHETLITPPHHLQGNATPSGNAIAQEAIALASGPAGRRHRRLLLAPHPLNLAVCFVLQQDKVRRTQWAALAPAPAPSRPTARCQSISGPAPGRAPGQRRRCDPSHRDYCSIPLTTTPSYPTPRRPPTSDHVPEF